MSKYAIHQAFMKKVMLHVQKKHPSSRLWTVDTGMAYLIPSVKEAFKYLLKTKDINGAYKKLRKITFGKKGHPDVTGILHGVWLGIEIKTNSATQSKEQKQFQDMIKKAGGICIVVSNTKDIDKQIESLQKVEEWAKNVRR